MSQKFKSTGISKSSFDDVIIGSSPMMLLQAGMLAREGRSVCLVEREEKLGGSWQIAELENGDRVEIACHLIEFFPGIYEFIEGASGAPFETLVEQPIRIHRSGIIVPYFSRLLMLASGVRLLVGLLWAKIDVVFGRATDRDRLINFQTKWSSYIKHQGPAFFQRPVMQGPKHGFVDFMDRLVKRSELDGVEFRQFDVASMSLNDGRWCLKDSNGSMLFAEHVHCTTSTNLRRISSGKFEATAQQFAHRVCIVLEVPEESIRVSQTYVAFWADPIVARISRIDMPQPQSYERYLMEFHNNDLESQGWGEAEVREHLERSNIIKKNCEYKVVGQVNCQFTTNVDQLPPGRIDRNLWGYFSNGNLAAGLSAWRKSERIPPLLKEQYKEV